MSEGQPYLRDPYNKASPTFIIVHFNKHITIGKKVVKWS